jgi:hypothetical protein
MVLEMWMRQERGRDKKLDGPLPPSPQFVPGYFFDPPSDEPGQVVPADCERSKKKRLKAENPSPC